MTLQTLKMIQDGPWPMADLPKEIREAPIQDIKKWIADEIKRLEKQNDR